MSSTDPNVDTSGNASILHIRALRLWSFIQKRASAYSLGQAIATLRNLGETESEQIRPYAKRLRKALEKQRITITHTSALQAASLILSGKDWYEARQAQLVHALSLHGFGDEPDEPLADWSQAGDRLVAICEKWALQHSEVRAFQIKAFTSTLVVSAFDIDAGPATHDTPTLPIAILSPSSAEDGWLTGVGTCLEKMRRRIEETGRATLDGLATLDFCDGRTPNSMAMSPITARDALNTELVLTREDNSGMPGSGYEIARGDELTCWAQLRLALEGLSGKIVIPDEDGAWVCDDARFVWSVVTLQPNGYVPGLTIHQMGYDDLKSLLHRYRVTTGIFNHAIPVRAGRKRLDYLGGPAETYRMDLHTLLLAMRRAGVTWEIYCKEIGEPDREMTAELPLGFVLPLLTRIKTEDPDMFFARPARSELSRADDDSILRALMQRVDHVRFRTGDGVGRDKKEAVMEAIVELRTSILMRVGIFPVDDPLPDLVYASDGEELLSKLGDLELVAFVGVLPHFRKFPPSIDLPSGIWPYAFGHSLYLEIEPRGA